jgi:hypothetical protein
MQFCNIFIMLTMGRQCTTFFLMSSRRRYSRDLAPKASDALKMSVSLLKIYRLAQGCQIFRCTIYQNGENIPNAHKIYQSAIKYSKYFENSPNAMKCTIAGPSQIYPNHLATLVSHTHKPFSRTWPE